MVSVIIPVFNAERFVEKAVKSALIQEEVAEVILIEDSSKDSSFEICIKLQKEFSSKIKLLRHPDGNNHGAGASRNLGIMNATSEFVAFLDADDYYLPNRFKRDLEILSNVLSIDGVYNALGVYIYDESERGRAGLDLTTVKLPVSPDRLFEEMGPLGGSGWFHGDALTVRRGIFTKVGLFDQELDISQDTHMWVKMTAKATLVAGIIEAPVAMRGVHRNNRIKDRAKFEHFRPLLFWSLLRWAKKNNLSRQRKIKIWNCWYIHQKKKVHKKESNLIMREGALVLSIIKGVYHYPQILLQPLQLLRILTKN